MGHEDSLRGIRVRRLRLAGTTATTDHRRFIPRRRRRVVASLVNNRWSRQTGKTSISISSDIVWVTKSSTTPRDPSKRTRCPH